MRPPHDDTNYALGSVLNNRDVSSDGDRQEAKLQMEQAGEEPEVVMRYSAGPDFRRAHTAVRIQRLARRRFQRVPWNRGTWPDQGNLHIGLSRSARN